MFYFKVYKFEIIPTSVDPDQMPRYIVSTKESQFKGRESWYYFSHIETCEYLNIHNLQRADFYLLFKFVRWNLPNKLPGFIDSLKYLPNPQSLLHFYKEYKFAQLKTKAVYRLSYHKLDYSKNNSGDLKLVIQSLSFKLCLSEIDLTSLCKLSFNN